MKILLIFSLILNNFEFNYFMKQRKNYKKEFEPIKIFIMTHKVL